MTTPMFTRMHEPEHYVLPPTDHVPNSPMPVLVYRDVLPIPRTVEGVQDFVESHGWARRGIVWPAIYTRHFHPNVHECYAILSGSSQVLMGVGALDDARGHKPDDQNSKDLGLILTLREGDVIVHPAGTAHSNISSEGHYRYLSFFPKGSPHWISLNGDDRIDLKVARAKVMALPVPQDPVLGNDGYLLGLWKGPRELYFETAT